MVTSWQVVGNIHTKNYDNLLTAFEVTIKNVRDIFLRRSVDFTCTVSTMQHRASCTDIMIIYSMIYQHTRAMYFLLYRMLFLKN